MKKKFEITEKDYERIKRLKASDDDFARLLFKNKKVTEYVLSIFLGKQINVVKNYTQYDLKNMSGNSAILDVYAKDNLGAYYNIEIQNSIAGGKPKRLRLNSALMDSNFNSGKYGNNLPKSFVIMYLNYDYFHLNEPYYLFTRKCQLNNKTIELNDDSYILYVNMKYSGNDEFGTLNRDFKESNLDKITETPLKNEIRRYKESDKEMVSVCRIWKEVKQEGILEGKAEGIVEGKLEDAVQMIMHEMDNALIQSVTGLSLEKITELREKVNKSQLA